MDWQFLLAKYIVKTKFMYGYRWTFRTSLEASGTEDFNIPTILSKSEGDFIDGGAAYGFWSIQAAKHYRRVLAVEPDLRAFKELVGNIRINHTRNVIPVEAALSQNDGTGTINLHGIGESSLLPEHMGIVADGQCIGAVELRSIDSLVQQFDLHPSVIKLDVEGAEDKALKGAWDTIGKYSPTLVVEVHHPTTPLQVRESARGYSWKLRERYLNQNIYPFEKQTHMLGKIE